jgi:transcriptional regulator with XRE-family HTH domain
MGAQTMELGRFLRGRRDALQPEDVGLPREPRRRVPGLRREEVAQLAGISPEYYLRLEQGRDHLPSRQVLTALVRALRLDTNESEYLLRLTQPSRRSVSRRTTTPVADELVATVNRLRDVPAYITDPNRDIVASNIMARLMSEGAWVPGNNTVLESFTPAAKEYLNNWPEFARRVVAGLRWTSDPADPRLQEIVGTLSVRDEVFRHWWAEHEVGDTTSGRMTCYFRGSGLHEVAWQELLVPGRPGYLLTLIHADPGSGGDAALRELAAQVEAANPPTDFEMVPRS